MSKNSSKYDVFCIFGKDGTSFSYKYDITLLSKKAKTIFSRKNTLEDGIAGIIKKDDFHPRKYGISSDRTIKDDKKVYFYKNVPMILCTFRETFKGVLIYCFPMKKNPGNLSYRTEI